MTYPEKPFIVDLLIPLCPGVPVRLVGQRPKAYAESPRTIGEHIKRARLIRALTQKQAAAEIGVASFTIMNWEKGYTDALTRCMPAVIRFLGYDPQPAAEGLGDRMLGLRRRNGWSIKEAAKRLGVDESTWGQWERTGAVAWPRYRELIEAFLGTSDLKLCPVPK